MSLRRRLAFAAVATVLVLGSIEGALRLVDFPFYFSETADMFGLPVLDMARARRVANRIIAYDPYYYWKFIPSSYLPAGSGHATDIRINTEGFRGPEFSPVKKPGVLRVVCLGDSTTFGWGYTEDLSYCSQVRGELEGLLPNRTIETLNLGVPGYSSRQGRTLLERRALTYAPDIVIFAFGPNDRLPAQYSDQEFLDQRRFEVGPVFTALSHTQLFKLTRAGVLYAKLRITLGEVSFRTLLPRLKRKVSQDEYVVNVRAASEMTHRAGALFVFLNVDFPTVPMDAPYLGVRDRAQREGLTLPPTLTFWDTHEIGRAAAQAGRPDAYVDVRSLFELETKRYFHPQRPSGATENIMPESYLMDASAHPNPRGHAFLAETIARDLAPLLASNTLHPLPLEEGEGQGEGD